MIPSSPSTPVIEPPLDEYFDFEAVDVTGTRKVRASRIQRGLAAGAVARGIATQLSLPGNVPWSFVGEEGDFLDDHQPIGQQLSPGATVMLVPKAHLG